MSILELIKGRRTIHSYTKGQVPYEVIQSSIEAATYAPNHKLTFPWRFILIGQNTRKKLLELSLNLKMKKEALSEVKKKAIENKFNEPASLIVVGIKKSESTLQEEEDYASLACGLQNMFLYLWEKGFGSKWSTGEATRDRKTYEILDLDPSQFKLCGFIWVGVADKVPTKPERPPLSKLIIKKL